MIWGNSRPTTVDTTAPAPEPLQPPRGAPIDPSYPPITVASTGGETVWIAEAGEDYREMEAWENGENWEAAYV